jgi:TonB family protein
MTPEEPRRTGFSVWVWISAGLHIAVFVGLFALRFLKSDAPPLTITTFELVGAPALGNNGGSPAPAEPTPSEPETTPSEPAPTPEETAPVETAQPEAVKTAPKPTPPKATAPSTTSSNTASKPSGGPASVVPGTPGVPGGDTLSIGGGGGPPSVMALWLSRVKFQVEQNWRAPAGLTGVTAAPEVVFSVARDGRHSRPKLRVRSGNPTLDRLALRAIESVDLFPPVPNAWPADEVALRYVLRYAP